MNLSYRGFWWIGLTGSAQRRYQGGNTVSPMSKSYFPTDRAGQIDWHNNFAKEFPKVGEKLGECSYTARAVINDQEIGQPSDTVTVMIN